MRCKFCSAPLPQKGLLCQYCGQRNPLNLTTLSNVSIEDQKSSHQCPTCNILCDDINIGTKKRIIIQRCKDCDGIFISENILEEIIQAQSVIKNNIDLHVLRFIKDNPRHSQETVIKYKKCPVCDITMHRLNYRAVSGVIVDKCHKHGIWLDAGELLQLNEWKKVGGELQKTNKEKTNIKSKGSTFSKPHQENNSTYFDPIGDFFNWIQGA